MFNLLAQIILISFYISISIFIQITLLNVNPNLSYNFSFMISNCFPRFQLQVVPHSVDSSTFISHCQRLIFPDHIEKPLTFGLMRSIQIICSSLDQFQGLERRLDQGFQYCTTDNLGIFFPMGSGLFPTFQMCGNVPYLYAPNTSSNPLYSLPPHKNISRYC